MNKFLSHNTKKNFLNNHQTFAPALAGVLAWWFIQEKLSTLN
jgi:hypothetical protein